MKAKEVSLFIKEGESLRVEFKERYSNKIDRDFVAFANTRGGYLIIGVKDDGKIIGAKLTNKLRAEIIDLARNCEPSIVIKEIVQIDNVIVIEIEESHEKPHSCSQGFFRRLDAVTQKMSQKEIKLLFKENTLQTPFEERINKKVSLEDISKKKIQIYFKEADISVKQFVPKDILTSLKLLDDVSIKNAGVLFFAKKPRDAILQCQMTCVAYKGTEGIHIYDRIDVQDDLLTQFNEAMMFLRKHTNVRSEIRGVNRYDIREIPLEALREAVVNAIVHRDYSVYGTSLMVEVHEDRVVISNPGGIPEGTNIKSLMQVSIRRNELIADIFARMDKAERLGSGLKRINKLVRAAGLQLPKIESNAFFFITFKRPFYSKKRKESPSERLKKFLSKYLKEVEGQKKEKGIGKTSDKILKAISKNKHVTSKELARLLNKSTRTIEYHLAKLKATGQLKREGSDKTGYWVIVPE